MQKNEGQAPIERVVTERRKGEKKKRSIGRSEEIGYCLCPKVGLAGGALRGGQTAL